MLQKGRTNQEETIQMIVPRNLMRRPFPLGWGLIALALFVCFALVTQLQFNRISNEKIRQARLDTYYSDVRAYDAAVVAHQDCLASIESQQEYRNIFAGVQEMFKQTAALPVAIFPDSPEAIAYQEKLTAAINEFITGPVSEELPAKTKEECPEVPAQEPERP